MQKMKNSGLEFVGNIPAHWTMHPVYYYFGERKHRNSFGLESNLLSLSYGKVVRKDINTTDGLLPTSFNTYNIIETDDIIIRPTDLQNDKRSLRTGLVTEHGIITSAYIALTPIRPLNSGYFYYLLHAFDISKVFYNMGNGVRQGLNYSEFSRLMVMEPPREEQDAIVAFLDTKCAEIDALAADIQSQIDTMGQYKSSVITEAVTKGLNPNVEIWDSGIHWVDKLPRHWDIIPSKYLFQNSDVRKRAGDVQLTASQNWGIIPQEEYMERTGAKIVFANQSLENWKHIEPDDFVISLRSFQGGLEMSLVTGCITWHYVVLKAVKPIVPRFYKWLFKSDVYIAALQRTCNFIRDGQDLRYSNFSQVPLYIPPMDEQRQIADFLDEKCSEIDTIIAEKRAQKNVLEQYKKSLIFEYVTGKKEVTMI